MGTPLSLELCRAHALSPSVVVQVSSRLNRASVVSPCPGMEQGWRSIPHVPAVVVKGWHSIYHVPGAMQGRHVVPCAMQSWCGAPCVLVTGRTGVVSSVSPVPSLLSLPVACAGRAEGPAQTPLHSNLPQVLLLLWPLRVT